AWQNGQWYQNGRPFYETTTKEARTLSQTVPYQPGWQKQLLHIAEERDRIEGRLRLQAQDFQSYLQGIKTLGLENNFHWQNYGQSVPYSPYATPYAQSQRQGPYGSQGNTLYGYTFSTIRDLYGDTSQSSMFQQQAKLAEGLQQLAGQSDARSGHNLALPEVNRPSVSEFPS